MSRAAAALLALPLLAGSAVPAAGQSRFTLSPYLGALFVDGSCVYLEGSECLAFSNGDPARVFGAVASYELTPGWRVEATYARSEMAGDPVGATPLGPVDDITTVSRGVPYWTVATLMHATIRHAFLRGRGAEVHATTSVGRIAFDARREDQSFADLLLGAGLGLRIGDGPIGFRADGRMFAQPCSEGERELERLACDDGAWLTHVEVSGGVVLTFPGVGSPASAEDD